MISSYPSYVIFLLLADNMFCIESAHLCRSAIKELSTGLSIENTNIECLYLRGSCYHAVGDYVSAV